MYIYIDRRKNNINILSEYKAPIFLATIGWKTNNTEAIIEAMNDFLVNRKEIFITKKFVIEIIKAQTIIKSKTGALIKNEKIFNIYIWVNLPKKSLGSWLLFKNKINLISSFVIGPPPTVITKRKIIVDDKIKKALLFFINCINLI